MEYERLRRGLSAHETPPNMNDEVLANAVISADLLNGQCKANDLFECFYATLTRRQMYKRTLFIMTLK